jgi:hypothetical protein
MDRGGLWDGEAEPPRQCVPRQEPGDERLRAIEDREREQNPGSPLTYHPQPTTHSPQLTAYRLPPTA